MFFTIFVSHQKGTQSNLIAMVKFKFGRLFCFVFFQFLCHMPLINRQILSILFVSLSHSDKQKFRLLHWIIATKEREKLFVALSHCDSTKFVYVGKKLPKSVNNAHFFVTWTSFCYFLGLFCLIAHYRKIVFFLNFLVTYTNFVCCSNSVQQTKFCLLKWLSATNQNCFLLQWRCATKNSEKIIQFLCFM